MLLAHPSLRGLDYQPKSGILAHITLARLGTLFIDAVDGDEDVQILMSLIEDGPQRLADEFLTPKHRHADRYKLTHIGALQ